MQLISAIPHSLSFILILTSLSCRNESKSSVPADPPDFFTRIIARSILPSLPEAFANIATKKSSAGLHKEGTHYPLPGCRIRAQMARTQAALLPVARALCLVESKSLKAATAYNIVTGSTNIGIKTGPVEPGSVTEICLDQKPVATVTLDKTESASASASLLAQGLNIGNGLNAGLSAKIDANNKLPGRNLFYSEGYISHSSGDGFTQRYFSNVSGSGITHLGVTARGSINGLKFDEILAAKSSDIKGLIFDHRGHWTHPTAGVEMPIQDTVGFFKATGEEYDDDDVPTPATFDIQMSEKDMPAHLANGFKPAAPTFGWDCKSGETVSVSDLEWTACLADSTPIVAVDCDNDSDYEFISGQSHSFDESKYHPDFANFNFPNI